MKGYCGWKERVTRIVRFALVLFVVACSVAGCSGPGHSSTQTSLEVRLKLVSYHGVHVDVPSSWPVLTGMQTGFCGGPFPASPTAFVGPQLNGAPSCPALLPADQPRHDGVWLVPEKQRPRGTSKKTSKGKVVLDEGQTWNGSVNSYWYHGVSMEIGIGPDPKVATAILDSIGFTPHAVDTRAEDQCVFSAHPNAMPTPERLTKPLILDRGQVTLDPAPPSAYPIVSASTVWQQGLSKEPFERPRLIFALYSAKLPAKLNANGSLTPLDQYVLAWVVYSVPRSPKIPGCGGWGDTVFDATTGQQVISSGWSPGP
jgi:hypothetical protein